MLLYIGVLISRAMTPATHILSQIAPDGYREGELNWQEFASDIARGDYERLNTQQCIDLDGFGKSEGVKVVVMLTNELSVSQGGNTAILSTRLIGGLINAGMAFSHDVEGTEFAGKTLMNQYPWLWSSSLLHTRQFHTKSLS